MKTQFLSRHRHKFGFPIPHPLLLIYIYIIALFPQSGDPIFSKRKINLLVPMIQHMVPGYCHFETHQRISQASLSQHPNIAVWATPSSQAAPSAAKLVPDATSSVAIASSPGRSIRSFFCLISEHQHWRNEETTSLKTLGHFHLANWKAIGSQPIYGSGAALGWLWVWPGLWEGSGHDSGQTLHKGKVVGKVLWPQQVASTVQDKVVIFGKVPDKVAYQRTAQWTLFLNVAGLFEIRETRTKVTRHDKDDFNCAT